MATKEQRVLNERESLVDYISSVQGQPLDFSLVLASIQNAGSARDLDSNLVSIFDLEDPKFSEEFTVVSFLGGAMGARAGNPKRLKEDEVETFAIKKREVNFEYALNLLENRVAMPKYYYNDLPKDLKKLSFYVSGLEKLREVELIKKSLSNAVSSGYSFQEWKDGLDVGAFENLSKARLQTVYRNNVNNVYNQSMRYNAGTSDVTPYLQYTAIGDSDTRPSHLKLDGVIKRADSVFWDKYTPPIDHNCRCGIISLTKEEAEELGISTRSAGSFPNPGSGFGDDENKTYGNVLGSTVDVSKKALNDLPQNSPYRSRFQNSIDSIDQKVDIWWESVKNIFRGSTNVKEIFLSQTFGLNEKTDDGKLTGKFEGVANSGQPVKDHWGIANLITDINQLTFKEQIPIFLNHWSEHIVGFASLEIKDNQLFVGGQISKSTEHGKQVLALAEEGFKWELSIGVSGNYEEIREQAVEVNGYETPIPSTIIRHGRIFEVSFCPIGADDKTFVNVFNKQKKEEIKMKVEFDKAAWEKFACGCGGTAESTLEELEEVIVDSEEIQALKDENEALKKEIEELKEKLKEEEEQEVVEQISSIAKEKGIELSAEKLQELASDKVKAEMFLEMASSLKIVKKTIDPKFTKKVTVSEGESKLLSADDKSALRRKKATELSKERGISFAEAIGLLPDEDYK